MEQLEKAYVSTGEILKKIATFLSRNQVEDAATLYSRCQEDIGYQLMSRLPSDKKLRQNLAKMFFTAKDFQKAGNICEELGEYHKAGQLYEKCDDYLLAAEMYARVDNHQKAAEMFERYGDYNRAAEFYTQVKNFEKAAQCFEKAINNFLAGKYYYHLKKYQKSMELLQKVSEGEANYLEASILIGNILAKHGYIDLAIRKYLNVIKNVPLNKDSISLYYNLGILYGKKGMWQEAKQAFLDVLDFDFNYKDTALKLKEVEARLAGGADAESSKRHAETAGGFEEEDDKTSQVVSVMEGFDFLKSTPLFEELSLAEIKAFYNASAIRVFNKGEIIIEQELPGKALYVVKKGRVIVQHVSRGTVADIVELGPGSHFGEMSLIDDSPTSARVSALEDGTEVFEITRDRFNEQLWSNDKTALRIYRVFINTLLKRLRDTTEELASYKSR